MKLNNIRNTDEDINNLDDYYSKEIEEYREIEKSLNKEINKLTAESTEYESKYYDMLDNFHNANEEIERLNNIIDGMEKYLKEENKFDEYKDITYRETMGYILNKLKELKGDNNEKH